MRPLFKGRHSEATSEKCYPGLSLAHTGWGWGLLSTHQKGGAFLLGQQNPGWGGWKVFNGHTGEIVGLCRKTKSEAKKTGPSVTLHSFDED